MQVMKSTFKRNFRLFSFTVKIDVEEANLAVVEEDISGVMLLYSAFPPPLAEAPSNEMNSP